MSRSSTEFMGAHEKLFHWVPGEMVVIVRLPRIPGDDAQELVVEQVRAQLDERTETGPIEFKRKRTGPTTALGTSPQHDPANRTESTAHLRSRCRQEY
jgi:hypothetical protein